jgi:6-phosphofructokinase 1
LKCSEEQIKENTLLKELKFLETVSCEIERVPNLVYDLGYGDKLPLLVNPILSREGMGFLPESAFVNENCFIL